MPSRRRTAGLCVAAVVAASVAGCGSSGGGHRSVAPSSVASAPSAAPTGSSASPDVRAQLLAVTDLPAGWSVDTAATKAPACLNTATQTAERAAAYADVNLTQQPLPAMQEALGYFPGGGATAAYTTVTGSVAGCGQVSYTIAGAKFAGSIGPLTFPAVADQSTAYSLNLNGAGGTIALDIIVFRAGDEVGLFYYADFGSVEQSEFAKYVALAVKKATA